MRILILGGDGMLGHQCLRHLRQKHEVYVTLHQPLDAYAAFGLFDPERTFDGVDVRSCERLIEVMAKARPQAVINGVGIVKQRGSAKEAAPSIEMNAMLPHRLAVLCRSAGARLLQISTDCVFSGRKGRYTEQDPSDAEDLYGKTKFLGEVHDAHGLTLRTSYIGLELDRQQGLVEWFLAQRGRTRGFRRAIYSGVTTSELSRLIERIFTSHPELSGLWHVASAPIDKHDLLSRLSARLGRTDVSIAPDDTFVCDRSLCADALERAIGYRPPSWDDMLAELADQIRERKASS
jgi:dTDP-4-dehydrorhamnose reductase